MDSIVWLYLVKLAVLIVFVLACAVRAYQNHCYHARLRWGLVALGVSMAFLATTLAYRVGAHLVDSASGQALLDSTGFWIAEIGSTASLIWLFFTLQKPRRGEHTRSTDKE